MRRLLVSTVLLAMMATSAHAELIYGVLDVSPALVFFDSTSPSSLTTIAPLSGLVGGQLLKGIDFRPSDGKLYALSNTGTAAQLYTVDLTTAALTKIGNGLTLTGNTSTRLSLDFDPVADVLRIVTTAGQNYRVDANTGTLIAQDTSLNAALQIGDIAYSNNVVGATSTTLYGYDYWEDNVGTIGSVGGTPNSPNTGTFNVLGATGAFAADASTGFDISGATGIGYMTLDSNDSPDNKSEFYTVDLGTGEATLAGNLNRRLIDISVRPSALQPPSGAVPEPGTLAFLGLALPVIVMVRHRKA